MFNDFTCDFFVFYLRGLNGFNSGGHHVTSYQNIAYFHQKDKSCGVYFVPKDDPSKAVKVTRLAENNPTKITGIAPKTESAQNSIVIRTQFTGSGTTLLKTPRIITSSFVLEEV